MWFFDKIAGVILKNRVSIEFGPFQIDRKPPLKDSQSEIQSRSPELRLAVSASLYAGPKRAPKPPKIKRTGNGSAELLRIRVDLLPSCRL
jgi:hypothetical protein